MLMVASYNYVFLRSGIVNKFLFRYNCKSCLCEESLLPHDLQPENTLLHTMGTSTPLENRSSVSSHSCQKTRDKIFV